MWRFPTISPQLSDSLTLETNFLLRLMKKILRQRVLAEKLWQLWKTSFLCCEKLVETGRNHRNLPNSNGFSIPPYPRAPHNVLNRRREGWILRRHDWAWGGLHPRMKFPAKPSWRLWNYQSTELSTGRYLDESRLNPITIDTNLRYQPTINHTGT